MRADQVEVSWDAEKSSWLVRIKAGEEVVRRHCELPGNAEEPALRSAALKTTQEEGYEIDPANVVIQRMQAA